MALIHPFKAWRPKPDTVKQIACVPYDVVNTEEAKKLAGGNPKSFLNVVRPEINLPDDTSPYANAVYEQGAKNLNYLMDEDILVQEQESSIYVYQLTQDGRPQTGIFTCVSVDDYDSDVILKHELTRPKKEDDRTKHINTQQAHAEPVMLTYKDDSRLQALIDEEKKNTPLFDFDASDGVNHKVWKASRTHAFVDAFKDISNLYIADGHHRCKAASRAAKSMHKSDTDESQKNEYNFFPAVVFPMSNMNIMAYNRIIHSVPDDFLSTLNDQFNLTETDDPKPAQKGNICIYIDGQWYSMELPVAKQPDEVEELDVYRLQEHLLSPLLDIDDPRRDQNISFVGGIRGTQELVNHVEQGDAAMAISMYPTDIQELVDVSDAGQLMPPKSTWFEPKLRSGLLVHTF